MKIVEPMAADNPYGIHIPSVFIGSESGLLIKENYLYEDGYYVLINDDLPFNFTPHLLLIFSVLVGLCFFVMIMFIVSLRKLIFTFLFCKGPKFKFCSEI